MPSGTRREVPLAWRVAAAAMSALFALSAALQWNDPDPLRWTALYGVAAGLSVAGACGRFSLGWNALACAGFAALAFVWAPSLAAARSEAFTSFSMRAAADEAPRETLGLALCAGWTGLQAALGWRWRGKSASRGNAASA